MKLSRFVIILIIALVFFSLSVSWPSTRINFEIPSNNPVMGFVLDRGWLDKNKVKENKYQVDKTLRAPDLVWGIFNSNGKIRLGLDLQGGTYVALKADMTNVADSEKRDKLNSVRTIIENRLNQFGLSETNIYASSNGSDYKVIVELPGSGADVQSQIEVLRTTAKLEILVPKDDAAAAQNPALIISTGGANLLRQSYIPSGITGADLQTASYGIRNTTQGGSSDSSGLYSVVLTFTEEGAKKFSEMETKYFEKTTAIMLDDTLLSAVTLQVKGGAGTQREITGNFDEAEAKNLALQLKAGALPVPVAVAEVRTIEASLGRDALSKSLLSGGIGILMVIIFMTLMYRKEGLIASASLLFYTLFSIAIFKLLAIHLSLAGFAGFILSIGIAVDANILIFERMKEEIARGKSKRVAMALGFERAWTSIRDSNVSTLITCFILWTFGTSVTKGFAINLGIGVMISLFTAITVTRQLLLIFTKNIKLEK